MQVTVQDRDAYLDNRHGENIETIENVSRAFETKANCVLIKIKEDEKEKERVIPDSVLLESWE